MCRYYCFVDTHRYRWIDAKNRTQTYAIVRHLYIIKTPYGELSMNLRQPGKKLRQFHRQQYDKASSKNIFTQYYVVVWTCDLFTERTCALAQGRRNQNNSNHLTVIISNAFVSSVDFHGPILSGEKWNRNFCVSNGNITH